jgi:hypothetical protein
MNSRSSIAARLLRVGFALLAICLALAPRAQADTIGISTVQGSVLVSGSSASVYSINAIGPGVLTVRLENISWPERLAQLDCSIYSGDGLLKSLSGTTEWQFLVTGPASFYASVFAGTTGRLNLGLYSFKLTFESAASLVPLPAAGWLLGSVLGVFGLRRSLPVLRFAFGRQRFA